MAEKEIIRAIKGRSKAINFSNANLQELSPMIGNVPTIAHLSLKGNILASLPKELSKLSKLQSINLGNNLFEGLPEVLEFIQSLKCLHLFGNRISRLTPKVLCGLENLTLLNLNNNKIQDIPPEICRLFSLELLSLNNNNVEEIPVEVCQLTRLTELHVAANRLRSIPEAIAFLKNLTKLDVHKNCLTSLPEGLTKCQKLRVLDVSANQLVMFPSRLNLLPLKELYCEHNNMLKHIPVKSVKEEEVLTLKEVSSRCILVSLRDSSSPYRLLLKQSPLLQEMSLNSAECVVCGTPFLNTWLECVRFVDCKKVFKAKYSARIVPIRGRLCSYRCFNTDGHDYFGVANVSE